MGKEKDSIGALVGKIIKDLRKDGHPGEEEIISAWTEAVGKKAAGHSKPVSLNKATLIVNVDNSGWLYEMTLKKREILEKLGSRMDKGKVKNIRLRVGDINKK